MVVQIYKTIFRPVTLPTWPVSSYFWLIFVYSNFFGFPLFAENHSIASHHFFTDVLGITQSVTSLNKPFYSIFRSIGSHFEVFWGSFLGMFIDFWKLFPIMSYGILYRCFSRHSQNQYAEKNSEAYPFVLGIMEYYCAYFRCIP